MSWLSDLEQLLTEFLNNMGVWAPFFCCALIFLEGILAFLPLFVFVAFNILALSNIFGTFFGTILGVVLSWIFSVLGSFTMFFLVRKILGGRFRNKIKNSPKVIKFMNVLDKLTYSQLVLITSIPFSPSFFINLGAGLSTVNYKKYFCALLIGKFAEMIFLGYVGVSLLECLTEPLALIKVAVIMVIGYMISIVVNKKFNLDERFE